jgi:hypothetical protein
LNPYDTSSPEAVANIIGDAPWGGENEVSWTASASADVATYDIYRGTDAPPPGNLDAHDERAARRR